MLDRAHSKTTDRRAEAIAILTTPDQAHDLSLRWTAWAFLAGQAGIRMNQLRLGRLVRAAEAA